MERNNATKNPGSVSDQPKTKITVSIHLRYWQEKIVAALSEDNRFKVVLEHESDFYERIYRICVHSTVDRIIEKEKFVGETLVRAGCFGLGKRFISSETGLSPVKAQELLNKYYAVFYRIKRWLFSLGRIDAFQSVQSRIDLVRDKSLERCLKNLPKEWKYIGDLRFVIPDYVYDVSISKFFKHFFENELEINNELVRLEVDLTDDPFDKTQSIPLL